MKLKSYKVWCAHYTWWTPSDEEYWNERYGRNQLWEVLDNSDTNMVRTRNCDTGFHMTFLKIVMEEANEAIIL